MWGHIGCLGRVLNSLTPSPACRKVAKLLTLTFRWKASLWTLVCWVVVLVDHPGPGYNGSDPRPSLLASRLRSQSNSISTQSVSQSAPESEQRFSAFPLSRINLCQFSILSCAW